MKLSSAFTGAVSAALLITAGACGAADTSEEEREALLEQSAAEIMAEARRGMLALSSVRVDLRIGEAGDVTEVGIAVHGENCAGTMTSNDTEVKILRVDGQAWLQADRDFWSENAGEEGGAVSDLIGEKWVVDDDDSFGDLCDLEQLLEPDEGDKTYSKTDELDEINGREAVKIELERGGDDGVAWIASARPHYVLKLEDQDGSFEAVFDDFDDVAPVEAPAEEDQVDLGEGRGTDGE